MEWFLLPLRAEIGDGSRFRLPLGSRRRVRRARHDVETADRRYEGTMTDTELTSLDRYATSSGLDVGRREVGLAGSLARRITSRATRSRAQMLLTVLNAPLSRSRARGLLLRDNAPVQLNLGSGFQRLSGWVNVDVFGMPVDLVWDLRRRLPFPDRSVDAIFCEHVLEHFDLAGALGLLREIKRLLKPDGTARVGVPDLSIYMEDYVSGGAGAIERERPGRPTRLLAVAEVTQMHGHRSAWDGETLSLALRSAGFDRVEIHRSGSSSLHPSPDTPARSGETVYAEAANPITHEMTDLT